MSPVDLQPAQLRVLQSILDKDAIVASALGRDLKLVIQFTAAVERFAFKNAEYFKAANFSLLLSSGAIGTQALTIANLKEYLAAGNSLLRVDEKLRVVASEKGDVSIPAALQRTKEARSFEIVFHPSTLHYIVYGQYIHDELLDTSRKIPPSQRWYRPFSEFPQILNDHMEGAVQYERDLRYWADRKKRILLATPDNTERIFHGKLRWWLDTFLTDKLRVYAQPTGFGQDSTDIIVITSSSAIFLIEVKWLGINEKGTKYDVKDINKALGQVKVYLNKDSDILAGYLIFYDGRSREMHETQSSYAEKHRHAKCQKPTFLFLESDTPSEVGAKIKT